MDVRLTVSGAAMLAAKHERVRCPYDHYHLGIYHGANRHPILLQEFI